MRIAPSADARVRRASFIADARLLRARFIADARVLRATAIVIAAAAALATAQPRPLLAGPPDEGFLRQYAATRQFRLGRPVAIRPLPDGSAVLFLRSGPRSLEQELLELDVATGREKILATASGLVEGAEADLSPQEAARRERLRQFTRGITSYQTSDDGGRVLIPLSGRFFVLDRAGGSVRGIEIGGDAEVPRLSPDGGKVAFVREGELYCVEVAGGAAPRRLTTGAGGTVTHGLAEFIAAEEMGRHEGFWWSPDAALLAFERADTAGVEVLTIADAANPQNPAQSWPYPRPGARNAEVTLGIVPAGGGEIRWVEWDREAWPYLATVKWQEGAPLTILVQDRLQKEEVLLAVEPSNGHTRQLLVETDEAWVELDQSMPRWLADGSAFLWTTQRRGGWQLEVRDSSGELVRVITPVSIGMQGFVHLDEAHGEVYIAASSDPTQTHLYRFSLDPAGGEPSRLTREPGVHGATFAKSGAVYVQTSGSMAGHSITVHRPGGGTVGELVSVSETPLLGWDRSATVELVTAGDDPAFRAAMTRPRDFESGRKYPVIVHVYGGPGAQMVRASAAGYLLDQWMADQGYIVVRIDGRGTPGRGRDWERAIAGNLIEAPLADQVEALRSLGAAHPELDLSRVGIFGWSFGGYFAAMAAMKRPDVFRAAAAGAPVTDWRDYDTHYTERYMGLPQENPSGYDAASALTWAPELARPLLVIHGTADDNVYFMHSLKLADALFRAGRPFELLPLAGFTHMVPDPLVNERLYERIMAFFATHLRP